MEITALSNVKNKLLSDDLLFDPVRKKWVESTPEERIRQALIQKMVGELGYPLSLLAVEKQLHQLPHLSLEDRKKIPHRRIDIVAFAVGMHPKPTLFPILMVECKAVPLTWKSSQQLEGYNAIVRSPFLALANGSSILTGQWDKNTGHYVFREVLFSYEQLLQIEMRRIDCLTKIQHNCPFHHIGKLANVSRPGIV